MSEFGPPGFLPADAFDHDDPEVRDLSLTEEQHVFVDCIEDILHATPGLTYHKVVDPAMTKLRARTPGTYAVFLIDTNPIYDLTVSIEMSESAFALVINGARFARRPPAHRSFERWIDQCCRLITRLTEGDLRIKQNVMLGVPQSTIVAVKRGRSAHELCKTESGWFAAMTWFVPFGLGVLIAGEQVRDYRNWYHSAGAAETAIEHEDRASHLPGTTNGDSNARS